MGPEAFRSAADQISVVSWNTLSKTWLKLCEPDVEYKHVGKHSLQWDHRRQELLKWMSRLSADIFTLQEVDFDTFEDAFLRPLSALGYDGLMQNNPKRADSQPCGNATFWRRDKFELSWSDHRSRTLLTEFKMKPALTQNSLIVINAHLESNQEKFHARASLVHSSLSKAVRRNPSASLILTGDFNTGADSSLCEVLREHNWFGIPLASAYEHPAASSTSAVVDATFRVHGHSYIIDHIWYQHSHLQLKQLLQPLSAQARAASLGPTALGLPDMHVPSDHIPVGAIFQWQECIVNSETLTEKKPGDGAASFSLDVVMNKQQRSLLQRLQTLQPVQKPRGRPSPEELLLLRSAAAERKELEQALLASLHGEDESVVRQVRALMRTR